MNDIQKRKEIKKMAKSAIHKKYRWECIGLLVVSIMLFYIEFLPCLYLPSIWNGETSVKINYLISQLSLAYIASFFFFYLNILKKEQRKYEDYFPQIIRILRNLFNVFDSHERCLRSLYKEAHKGDTFTYNEASIRIVIEYLKDRENKYLAMYKDQDCSQYTPAYEISGNNHLVCRQIFYDIELLNNFSEILDSNFTMALFRISQNQFILRLKDEQINDLKFYTLLVEEEVKLYKEIESLKKEFKILFG